MKKKTYKGWQKSGLDLDEYLGEDPCIIDEDLHLYIGECTAPAYCTQDFLQGGDPILVDSFGVDNYMTVKTVKVPGILTTYYYLGILPLFN